MAKRIAKTRVIFDGDLDLSAQVLGLTLNRNPGSVETATITFAISPLEVDDDGTVNIIIPYSED